MERGESARARLVLSPTLERLERLEEALHICRQMWSDNDGPFESKHYRLDRTLSWPQALSGPHPPILIGGAGEKKTLRRVARYADSCNIFDSLELAHKLDVRREHCTAQLSVPVPFVRWS